MEFLKELLAKFDVEVVGAEKLQGVNSGMAEGEETAFDFSKMINVLGAAFAALGLGAATAAVYSWVSAATEAVDEIGKLSTTLHISTDAIQKWSALATTSGGSTSDFSAIMRKLTKNMFDAERTAGPAREAFEQLGVAWADSAGNLRPLEDVLLDASAAIGAQTNNSDKLALAQETLGRGALKLIPGFKGTREEMKATLEQMGELAGVYDEDFIRASEAANDEIFFMKNQWEVLKSVLVMLVLPAFRFVINSFRELVAGVRSFLKETEIFDRWFQAGKLAAMGAVLQLISTNWRLIISLVVRALAFLRPFAPIVAKFIIWALVLDDIITFLTGGNSLLGDFIDKAFGIGTAESIQRGLADAWDLTNEMISAGGSALGTFFESLENGDSVWEAATNAAQDWATSVGDFIRDNVGAELKSVMDTLVEMMEFISGGALKGIADVIYDADNERMNMQAALKAQDRARGISPRAPGSAGGASSYVDNSQTSVNLEGRQTPETVAAAGAEARKITRERKAGRKPAANSLVRGKT